MAVPIWSIPVTISSAIDRDEVRRMLGLMLDPDTAHEVRALPSGQSVTITRTDLDAAVRAVEAIAGSKGTYITLNPVRPDLTGAARVKDITCRRHLLIDCDPERADRDGMATEAEHAVAKAVIDAVLDDLTARGWPRPIMIDSGNGWHLLYRIDLPNDKLAQQLLSKCLKALQAAHGTDAAKIDTVVHNASRITKLAGTWVRKGESTTDRPHRMARLVSVPTAIVPVDVDQIRELAGLGTTTPPDAPPVDWTMTVPGPGAGGLDAYVRKAIEAECGKVATAREGARNDALNVAAFSLGTLLHLAIVTRQEVEHDLAFAAQRAGLTEHETTGTIRSGIEAGLMEPRQVEVKAGKATASTPASETIPPGVRLTIRASAIKTRPIRWLWRDRVPVGFITVFAGRTGLGKSFVTCDLAARITQGEDLPDGPSGLAGECRDVLFISEDPYEYVLAPRLMELGADLNRVSFLTWEAMARYTLDDTPFLERAYAEVDHPALVVIDPPTNFLGDAIDEHKNSAVRAVLMHLVQWIKDKDAACVLITHVNKQSGKGIDALNRVIGSVAWTTTARIVHSFAPNSDIPGHCLFVPMKNNLGPLGKGLGYTIRKTDTLAVVEWTGEVDTTADEAMSGERQAPRKVKATDWLIDRFKEDLRWFSEDLWAAAKHDGISRNAIFEAKDILCLPRCDKEQLPGGKQAWVWWVPPDWPHLMDDEK
jgi:hypothetical protein